MPWTVDSLCRHRFQSCRDGDRGSAVSCLVCWWLGKRIYFLRISTAKADANNKAGARAGRFHTGSGTDWEIILAVIPETKCNYVSTRQKGFSKAENHTNCYFEPRISEWNYKSLTECSRDQFFHNLRSVRKFQLKFTEQIYQCPFLSQ